MATKPIIKVHKDLYQLMQEARSKGIQMTIASKQLADFARDKGFQPFSVERKRGRPSRNAFRL